MTKLAINWQEPCQLKDVVKVGTYTDDWTCSGVYLWLHADAENPPAAEARNIAYVGRALGSPNLLTRLREHYLCFLGGLYCVTTTRADGSTYEYVPRQWNQDDFQEVINDEERFMQLHRDGRKLADSYWVSVARYSDLQGDHGLAERELLSRLESQLIYSWQPAENTRGKKSAPSDPLELEHVNPPWVQLTF